MARSRPDSQRRPRTSRAPWPRSPPPAPDLPAGACLRERQARVTGRTRCWCGRRAGPGRWPWAASRESAGHRVGQRRHRGRPAAPSGVPVAGLVHQRECPGPAVGPLARPPGPAMKSASTASASAVNWAPSSCPDLLAGTNRPRSQQAHQQPVHLHAGMPVEAAVEDRRPLGGPGGEVPRFRHQVDKQRRELPADVGHCHLSVGDRLLVQDIQALRGDPTGRADLAVTHGSSLRAPTRRTAAPGPPWRWALFAHRNAQPLGMAVRMAGMDTTQLERIRSGQGFFAALDQSGGSTPKALAEYGIDKSRYTSEEEMFDLVHAMRTRVITDPAFDGSRILAAILFEQTMDRDMQGVPTARYLWAAEAGRPVPQGGQGARRRAQRRAADEADRHTRRAARAGRIGTGSSARRCGQ